MVALCAYGQTWGRLWVCAGGSAVPAERGFCEAAGELRESPGRRMKRGTGPNPYTKAATGPEERDPEQPNRSTGNQEPPARAREREAGPRPPHHGKRKGEEILYLMYKLYKPNAMYDEKTDVTTRNRVNPRPCQKDDCEPARTPSAVRPKRAR
jgi:hypothetical protein